jgi:hypothetical protein
MAVSIRKCWEDGDGIFHPLEGRIQSKTEAEFVTDGPVGSSGFVCEESALAYTSSWVVAGSIAATTVATVRNESQSESRVGGWKVRAAERRRLP